MPIRYKIRARCGQTKGDIKADMLRSMTGYGRQELIADGKRIYVEVKSVNHRYSDFTIKYPRRYAFLEDKIKKRAAESITRGKVDISLTIENYESVDEEITINRAAAENYIEALKKLRDEFSLTDDITVMGVARNQDVFTVVKKDEDEDVIWNNVKTALDGALEEFTLMRRREGERIQQDLEARIEYMKTLVERVDERSPETVAEYRNRLYDKIKEVLEDGEIDEGRVLTEVAIFADKVAVNEETVRLKSHFVEFNAIINSGEPAGRRLDFLIQEINRETNTIGSKASDIEIAKIVVELKGEIEKLREQIQNIE